MALPPRRVLLRLKHQQDLQLDPHHHQLVSEVELTFQVKGRSVVEESEEVEPLILRLKPLKHNYKNLNCKMTLLTKSAISTSVS